MTKRQVFIIILATFAFAAVWAAVIFVAVKKKDAGKFTPPPFEENAEPGAPEIDDERFKMFDFAGVYSAGLIGEPEARNGIVDIYFTSAETNTVWLKCKILSEDGKLLAETGVLKPGTYVKSVTLQKEIKSDTPIKYRVISYTPETYYSEGSVNIGTTLHIVE